MGEFDERLPQEAGDLRRGQEVCGNTQSPRSLHYSSEAELDV
jgi:hypothetical protein